MGTGAAGGVEGAELTCAKDSTPTRLTCVKCRVPICPQCMVRTPVGMKCADCGAEPGSAKAGAGPAGTAPQGRARAAWLAPLALLGLVALVIVLPRILSSSGDSAEGPEEPGFLPNAEGPARIGSLGNEVRDADLAFVVTDLSCGAREVTSDNGSRAAQGQFCMLTLDVRNVGRSPATFPGRTQALMDGANRRFGPDAAATLVHPANAGKDLLSPVVNPGNQLTGVLVFDVPFDVRLQGAALRAGPGGPGAVVRLPS